MQRSFRSFVQHLFFVGLAFSSAQALATANFAKIFTSNMVLQRGKPVHVWGTAAASEGVTVTFNGQTVTNTAALDGRWSLYLGTLSADTVGKTLSVQGSANTVNLTNVVVGDIWLCSGQSNMEFPLSDANPPYGWPGAASPNGTTDASSSNLPNLRIFNVPSWPVKVASTPQQDLPAGMAWTTAVGASNPNLKYTSALGFYFCRTIQVATGVPIGLLEVAYGGSPAEAFISLEALQAEPSLAVALPVGTPTAGNPNWWPTGIFNGELNPVTPMTIKGVLWDQGESNTAVYSGSASNVPTTSHNTLFTTLIKDWRNRFGEELPFYFVQIQNISQLSAAGVNQAWADNCNALQTSNNGWSDVRWGHFEALSLTKTGMSVNFDLNPAAQYWNSDATQMAATDYHPTNKEAFAARIAPWAETADYGLSVGAYKGPLYQSYAIVGSTIQVTFDSPLSTSDSLAARGFMLGNAGGSWVWADTVTLAGNVATVSAAAMVSPTKVKYAWGYNPADTLCGPSHIGNLSDPTKAWLASPFQTTVEPAISLTGLAGAALPDQNMVPTLADGRDFGSVDMVSPITQTFTIHNSGSATLSLSGGASLVRIAGANASDFSITAAPASSVLAGNSTTFTVRFQPGAVGPRSAYLLIPSNDGNHSPYYVYLQGSGTSSITPTITQTPTITATPTQTPLTTPVPTGTYTVLPSDPNIRYTGRFDFAAPNAPRFDWPGIMIEAGFTGTRIGILLSEQWANYNWYDAYIDGSSTPTKFQTTATASTQYAITGLSAGSHTLRLVHRGEGFSGDAEGSPTGSEIATFNGLVLNGGEAIQALPYPRPSRRIEVIGDSISCGYGDESASTTCGAPDYERPYTNNYLAYASLVSRNFCAEVHTTAVSGHGMCHNYNSGSALSAYPVPALYNRTLGTTASPLYDFSAWQADAVIIYLGTNDFSNINPPSQAQYETAYKALIADVRSKYTTSVPYIFCLHANYPATYATWVTNVVNYEHSSLSDLKVIDVDLGSLASANACSNHPDLVGQQLLANTVSNAIQTAMGWSPGVCATNTPTSTPCALCTSTNTPTITLTPTITPTAAVPCEDWNFDSASLQGWTVNTGPGTGLAVSAGTVHDGAGSLTVDLALAQGGGNNGVILSDFTGFPKDYTGKILHAWVYVPAGMSDASNPSAAMLVLSSSASYHWNSSPWVNLSNAGGWSEITLDTSTQMAYPAEVNDIRAISVQFALGGTSPAWSGTVHVDSVGRTTGVCAPPTATSTITTTQTPGSGSATSTATRTATRTITATPSSSATATRSATVSSTATSTPTISVSPTATMTFTDVPPGSTLTNTPVPTFSSTVTATSTVTPLSTATPTASVTALSASSTPTASNTPIVAGPSYTDTPTVTPTYSRTMTPTDTSTNVVVAGTSTFTLTSTPTQAPSTAAAAPNQALIILALQAVPNPNPAAIAIKLSGVADDVELKVFSVAGSCVTVLHSGGAPSGWSQVLVPSSLANGEYFVRAVALWGSFQSPPLPPLKVVVLK